VTLALSSITTSLFLSFEFTLPDRESPSAHRLFLSLPTAGQPFFQRSVPSYFFFRVRYCTPTSYQPPPPPFYPFTLPSCLTHSPPLEGFRMGSLRLKNAFFLFFLAPTRATNYISRAPLSPQTQNRVSPPPFCCRTCRHFMLARLVARNSLSPLKIALHFIKESPFYFSTRIPSRTLVTLPTIANAFPQQYFRNRISVSPLEPKESSVLNVVSYNPPQAPPSFSAFFDRISARKLMSLLSLPRSLFPSMTQNSSPACVLQDKKLSILPTFFFFRIWAQVAFMPSIEMMYPPSFNNPVFRPVPFFHRASPSEKIDFLLWTDWSWT